MSRNNPIRPDPTTSTQQPQGSSSTAKPNATEVKTTQLAASNLPMTSETSSRSNRLITNPSVITPIPSPMQSSPEPTGLNSLHGKIESVQQSGNDVLCLGVNKKQINTLLSAAKELNSTAQEVSRERFGAAGVIFTFTNKQAAEKAFLDLKELQQNNKKANTTPNLEQPSSLKEALEDFRPGQISNLLPPKPLTSQQTPTSEPPTRPTTPVMSNTNPSNNQKTPLNHSQATSSNTTENKKLSPGGRLKAALETISEATCNFSTKWLEKTENNSTIQQTKEDLKSGIIFTQEKQTRLQALEDIDFATTDPLVKERKHLQERQKDEKRLNELAEKLPLPFKTSSITKEELQEIEQILKKYDKKDNK